MRIMMSKEVEMFLSTLSPEDQEEFLKIFDKIANGEIVGEPATPEEIEELERMVGKIVFPEDREA